MLEAIKEVNELKNQSNDLRKKIIVGRMEIIYDYEGVGGLLECVHLLKECTPFKCGDCVDFETFRKEFLISFENLRLFYDVYYNTALDVDELVYVGFKDNLSIVSVDKAPDKIVEEIMNYNFSDDELDSLWKSMGSIWEGIEALYL